MLVVYKRVADSAARAGLNDREKKENVKHIRVWTRHRIAIVFHFYLKLGSFFFFF